MGIIKFKKNGKIDEKASFKADVEMSKMLRLIHSDTKEYKNMREESFNNKCMVINELYGIDSEYSIQLIKQLKIDYKNNYDISL